MQKIVGSNPGTGIFLFLSFMFTDTWTCTFNVCTWYVHGLKKYVHEHACKYMFVRLYAWSEHVWTDIYEFRFIYACLNIVYTLHRLSNAMYVHVCTWFILVHPGSNHEHAKLFSPISISLRYAIWTRLYRLWNRYVLCYRTGIVDSIQVGFIKVYTP